MDAQIREIQKYKRIQSQKAGKDLGNQAVHEWITKYAGKFAKDWERKHGVLNSGECNSISDNSVSFFPFYQKKTEKDCCL